MKNILVPVDFSTVSMRAMHYSASIAKILKAEIILFHVDTQVKYLTASVLAAVQQKSTYAEVRLKRLSKLLNKQYGIKCSYDVRRGDIPGQICVVAQEKESILIVMGTRGAKSLREKLVGTQTEKVIRRGSSPVLAVPAGAKYEGWKNILYATDYHPGDEKRISAFTSFTSKFGPFINIVHLCRPEDREPERMILDNFAGSTKKQLRYRKLSFRLVTGKTESALSSYARSEGVNLMVFSADNKSWLKKLVGSGTTRRMAFHTKIPFMAWRHE